MNDRASIGEDDPLTRVLFRASASVSALVVCALAAHPATAQPPAQQLTVKAIYAHDPMIGQQPAQLRWSPDGKLLSYLNGGELIGVDTATGEPHVLVNRARMAQLSTPPATEQDRDHRDRYGMASYLWAPDSAHLLFDPDGHLWLYDLRSNTGVQLGYSGMGSGDDPKFSPNGRYVSFIREHGLTVMNLRAPGTPALALEPSHDGDILNGEVDWVYAEELDARSNYYWSPDSKNLAFLQMDETRVPEYPLVDWLPVHAKVALQHYPQPGDPSPTVRVGIVSAGGGKTRWIKLPITEGQDYIPRFGWVDAHTLWIETLTRDQKHRSIYFANAATGQTRLALTISDDKFLDDNYDITVDSGFIVLTNWSDGHNHIYLYSYNTANPLAAEAQLVRKLTQGNYEVSSIDNVDVKKRLVQYESNQGDLRDQQIWQVSFDGQTQRLTTEPGYHFGNFAADGVTFVDKFSTRMDPPTLRFCREPDQCSVLWSTHALDGYRLHAPEQLEVKADDGTMLYATLLLPKDASRRASVPLIVNPYGGPGPQMVVNKWSDSLLFDELLAQQGFAVLHADNRGTGGRGRTFAQAAYHNFGPVQLQDQLTVVDAALAKYPQLDAKRLGWWGWSWGGSFTLYAMTHTDRFSAGVAVAPVTDWRDYDSIYTERYLSTPNEFPEGYRDFSVVNWASRLHGQLLLAHGTGDDNVHIGNSVQFIQQLIEAGIPYDLQIFPRKTHSILGGDVRTELYNAILQHFEQNLMKQ